MRGRRVLGMLVGVSLAVWAGSAQAISLALVPVFQEVGVGGSVEVALAVSGLGNGAAPSVSVFDVDVGFNPSVLAFDSVVYGDPVLGDQLDLLVGSVTATTPGTGTVNLFELSLDAQADLDALQAASFTLATLRFHAAGPGSSVLGLSLNALGDAAGDPLMADLAGATVRVRSDGGVPIPEPGSCVLLITGLGGLAGFLRRRSQR